MRRQRQKQAEARCWTAAVVVAAGMLWQKYSAWADTHCWKCDGQVDEADWKSGKCPHCGVDLIPF